MKLKGTIIFVLSLILMFSSCSKNNDITIIHNENIINETAMINTESCSYSVTIPISTNEKVDTLSLVELHGSADSITTPEIDFNKDEYIKFNGNYIYNLTLKFEYSTEDTIEINKLKLMINNQELIYNIGSIEITDSYISKRNYDDIIYFNSPITAYEYGSYNWEAEIKQKIKIKKIYLSSSDVEVSGLYINDDVISDNMQIDKTYSNEKLNIRVNIDLLNNDFENSIIGCDLVIEYIDLENDTEYISIPPAIFRIYACGEDYKKLYN